MGYGRGRRKGTWGLFILCLLASLYGLALIFSATRYDEDLHSAALKQAVALAVGVAMAWLGAGLFPVSVCCCLVVLLSEWLLLPPV